MHTDHTDTEKKPLDYLKIIFRRKWLLIIPIVLGLVGGLITGNLLPKLYRASTLILVEEGRIKNPLVKDFTSSTSTAQRLTVLREQILGWDRINQLINTLNLAKNVKTQEQFEKLVLKLRRSIVVLLNNNSLVSIFYEGKDPAESQKIVQTITDIFIAENLRQQTQETENAINFIDDQLVLYQRKLKQGEVARMRDQLKALLVDSTDKHPMVIDLRKKIASAEVELEKGIYNIDPSYIAGSDKELASLQGELKEIKNDIETSKAEPAEGGANRAKFSSASNEKLYKLLMLQRAGKSASQDKIVDEKLYNLLLERLETARITQSLEASKEGTRYTILDPARLPLRPVKPNKVLVLFMGLFIGACVGMGLVFSAELFDNSFLGLDEAKVFLGLPILGGISKIITHNDLKAQTLRRTKITSISVAGGVILLVIIIFNVVLG